MSKFSLISIPTYSTSDGNLSVLEKNLPFDIKRVYWIYGADGFTRGHHRHKTTHQALIAVHGSVEVFMSDGITEKLFFLNSPSEALIVEPEDWHTMKFNNDAILLVLASTYYTAEDYIDSPY